MTPRRRALVIVAMAASGISCGLLLVQVQEPHVFHYWYMAWNLALAWIPMVLAVAFSTVAVQRRGDVARLTLFVAWLLFLPNAPYMATDVIHLQYGPVPPVHYVMFAAFALTGLVLGLGSVYVVHCALWARWGRHNVAPVVYGCLVLCGIGLYLGRVVQVNSWDVFVAPGRFLRDVGGHVDSRDGAASAVSFVAVSAGALALTYGVSLRVGGRAKPKG
jgi:uncharacterized membrane protein